MTLPLPVVMYEAENHKADSASRSSQDLPPARRDSARNRAITLKNAHTFADMVHRDSDGPIEALHLAIDRLAEYSK